MQILSLDQATNKTGYALLENDKIITYGVFDVSKEKDVVIRISKIKKWLNEMLKKYKPDIVGMENVQYQANPLSHKILSELLGVLENNLYEKDIAYFIIEPSSWRSELQIKGRKREEQKANAQKYIYNNFDIEVDNDTADAICIGIATYRKCRKK